MDEAVMVKASDRLPWLESPRSPPPRGKARGMPAMGVAGLAIAGAASLILLRQQPVEAPPAPLPMARLDLPSAAAAKPEAAKPAPRVQGPATPNVAAAQPRQTVRRSARGTAKRRVLKSPIERLAYREVLLQQSVTAAMPTPPASDLPTAEPLPAPYAPPVVRPTPVLADPPLIRPTVNPAAALVRGKTVQLGAYQTPRQAEIAWRRAIRDYTFLVTFPKNIQLVHLGPRKLRFYRLQLGTPSKRHARQLCSNLKTTGRNCTVA